MYELNNHQCETLQNRLESGRITQEMLEAAVKLIDEKGIPAFAYCVSILEIGGFSGDIDSDFESVYLGSYKRSIGADIWKYIGIWTRGVPEPSKEFRRGDFTSTIIIHGGGQYHVFEANPYLWGSGSL